MLSLAALPFLPLSAAAPPKKLKVFILAGQSNMEGHAQTKTFPAIAKDPKTADLYKEILVGSYPSKDQGKGKKAVKDYSEYSRLLACLIRDVRKDLSAPKLPFVIGVLGVGGETTGDNPEALRAAMAAPGETPEFKGTVANVFTHKFWPVELDAVLAKTGAFKAEFAAKVKELQKQKNSGGDWKKDQAKLRDWKKDQAKLLEEMRAKIEQTLTKDELFLLDNGVSNKGFHYYGSGKFFAQIGKAFAEANHKLLREQQAKWASLILRQHKNTALMKIIFPVLTSATRTPRAGNRRSS